MPPVLQMRSPEILAGLTPFFPHAIQRGGDNQDHKGKLEVQVRETQSPEAVEVETRIVQADAEKRFHEGGDESHPSECRDECECQRDSREIRCHP